MGQDNLEIDRVGQHNVELDRVGQHNVELDRVGQHNAAYMVANGFLGACWIVREDFGRIPKGSKSAEFHRKAWGLAHGFEADFVKCTKSSRTP